MSKSYEHFIVFGPSQREVAAALTDREAAIAPTVNGFTLVADQELAHHDTKRVLSLATDLSRRLRSPVIWVSQFKGDVLSYTLIEAGTVADEYTSEPDYEDFTFRHVPPRGPQGGDAKRVCSVLHRDGAVTQIDRILHGGALSAEDRYRQFVAALGMPGFADGFGVGALVGIYPDGLTESDVMLTTAAREAREAAKRAKPPTTESRRDQEKLPTGKIIRRSFDANGAVVEEFHLYGDSRGATAIGLRMRFAHGRKTGESYFGSRRVVSRDVYQRERAQYADMPAADLSVRDTGADGLEQLALLGEAQREYLGAAYSPAKVNDSFCTKVMERGRSAIADEWVKSANHALAEMDSAEATALIARLKKVGTVAIHVCGIYVSPNGGESSSRLVVELPTEAAARAALLREVRPLLQRFALQGDADIGQRFVFVRVGF